MILDIVETRNPDLHIKSKPVKRIDKKVLKLIADMKETLLAQEDPEGVGLAAPQVSKNIRVFIMKPHDKILVLINPKIISVSKKKTKAAEESLMEGCLSLPHYYSPLQRPEKITVEFKNEKGEKQRKTFEGFEAQIVQHELDHLNGIIFIDRVLEQKKPLYQYINGDWEEVDFVL